MPNALQAVAFDLIGTLFPLQPLRPRLEELGLEVKDLELWFAHVVRDGMVLSTTGDVARFSDVAGAALEALVANLPDPPARADLDRTIASLTDLDAAADAVPALQRVRAGGARALVITNGSARDAWALLARGGLDGLIDAVVSAEELGRWKPSREVYLQAVYAACARPESLAVVSAHAWDCHGAKRAGLRAAWVAGVELEYPRSFRAPDVSAATLTEACEALLAAARTPPAAPGTPTATAPRARPHVSGEPRGAAEGV